MSSEKKNIKHKSIARSAAVMGVATFFSRIAGLLREQTFAYLFGAGIWTDAFNVAFRIPNLLRDLFAEGAMSAAFIPTFNAALQKDGKDKAFRLTNLTLSALFLVVGLLTFIGIIFAPVIVKLIAPDFAENAQKLAVTITMTRIMFPFLLTISLAAIVMGILNSMGEFFIPAIAPAFLNFSMIISGWTLCPIAKHFNSPAITGMAIGAMLGGMLQFAVQLPMLIRHGFRFSWMVDFKDPGIRRIIKLIIPGTVGLAATQINIAIITVLATSQGDGAVSWLTYAFRLMQLPLGLFGVAIAQATLPVISRQAADNNKAAMAKTLAGSIKLSVFINLFACFSLFALAEPIIRILFQHGKFSVSDTYATALALRAYSFGLVFFCLIKVLGPAFYALNETKIPVFASITSVIVNIILNLLLIKYYGYWSLALATGIGAMFNAGILFFMIQKRLGGFSQYSLFKAIGKNLIATASTGVILWKTMPIMQKLIATHTRLSSLTFLNTSVSLVLTVILGSSFLFFVSWIMKIEEAKQAFELIKKKIKK